MGILLTSIKNTLKSYLKYKEKQYMLSYRYYKIYCPQKEYENTMGYKYSVLANEIANLYQALWEAI